MVQQCLVKISRHLSHLIAESEELEDPHSSDSTDVVLRIPNFENRYDEEHELFELEKYNYAKQPVKFASMPKRRGENLSAAALIDTFNK